MNFDVSIPVWVILTSTLFRGVAAWDYWFVFRKATQEAGVKNGLEILRKQLQATSIILLFMNTAGLFVVFFKVILDANTILSITNGLTVLNSLLFWTEGRILRDIYSRQYTPEQKRLHEEIEKKEKAKRRKKRV